MYTDYFGLSELPFSIAPNPDYLYMSKRHREALAHLLYGVQADGGFILLTGEVGTGKTTLCRCVLQQIPMDVETAFVLNPRVSATELLSTIADEFGFHCADHSSLKSLTDSLNSYLLEQHALGKKSVLIIDEAQNLDRDVLEQLRLLTNLETNDRKLLQIILLGQPELAEILRDQNLRQFSQRITARYHLEALDSSETKEYIRHRLAIAGNTDDVFPGAAIRQIFRLSGGIPRLINLISDRSLLGAYAEDRKKVRPSIVKRAAVEVLGDNRQQGSILPLALAAGLLVAIAATWYRAVEEPEPVAEAVPTADQVPQQSQIPEPVPAPAPIVSATDIHGHQQLTPAWHDLFALWGAAFEDRQSTPCDLAGEIGLMCMYRIVDWQELLKTDRPAVVEIDNEYLTLSRVDGNTVTLFAGDRQFELDSDEFRRRFSGGINMLWRAPPDYRSPLTIDDEGAAVDWLVVQMAVIEGEAPPLETGFVYSEQLASRVRDFQASVGLAPSGIVDPITWIHINSVEAISIPTLKSS